MPTKILLIEDNIDHILFTERILKKANQDYQVDFVSEAQEGLRKIIEENYDLILCDYRLSGLTALDILRKIREKGKDSPFIVVTSAGSEKIAVELMRQGAYDYLVKDQSYEDILPVVIEKSVERYKNIIERKKAEEALWKSEERFKQVADSAGEFIWEVNSNGLYTYASPIIEKMLGYKPEEIVGKKHFYDFFSPDVKDTLKKTAFEVFARKGFFRHFVNPNTHRNGKIVYLETSGTPIIGRKGNLVGYRGVDTDITERKQAEEKLRFFSLVVEQSSEGMAISNLEGYLLFANPAWINMHGYESYKELSGKHLKIFHSQEQFEQEVNPFNQKVKEKGSYIGEVGHIRKDGTAFLTLMTSTLLRDADRKPIALAGIAKDITKRKKAEKELKDAYQKLKGTQEQLIQSSKMAAMGQLAAGISHELNQPLTGIKGFAQAVLMDLDEGNPLTVDLQRIVEQADRMDKIIRNVRLFARKSEFRIEELDINQPLKDSLMLLSEQFRVHNIRLTKSLTENLPRIKGDANQLQQVFLNLITNARDAINRLQRPEGGELIIKTSLSKDNNNIEITLQDTGCGISKEGSEHIFNPFFTTKSPDGGMGLGLSIVYRIIENHKGRIEVESEEWRGASFKITLPVANTDDHYHR